MPIPIPVELDWPLAGSGLLAASRPLPEGWTRGVSFLDPSCTPPAVMGECPTDPDLKPVYRPGRATFRPVTLVQALTCTAANNLDLGGLSAAELDRTRDYALARELLTGEASARDAGPDSDPNPSLIGEAVDMGDDFASVAGLFGCVEAAVNAANFGRGAVLFAPIELLTSALEASVVWRDGARWRTGNGATVVVSAGFDGRAPGDDSPAPAVGDPLYLYGSTAVWAGVGERTVLGDVDRAVNDVNARAEDVALAVFAPCVVFAGAATGVTNCYTETSV